MPNKLKLNLKFTAYYISSDFMQKIIFLHVKILQFYGSEEVILAQYLLVCWLSLLALLHTFNP